MGAFSLIVVINLLNRFLRMTIADKIAKATFAVETSQISSLQVYKRLIRELKYLNSKSPKENARSEDYRNSYSYKFFYSQFLHNDVTDQQLCRPRNELLQRANDYATYLNATRKLEDLRSKYSRGERSIEAAAALCGLNLPSDHVSNAENGQ